MITQIAHVRMILFFIKYLLIKFAQELEKACW